MSRQVRKSFCCDGFAWRILCPWAWNPHSCGRRLFPDLPRRSDPGTSLYRALANVYGIQVAFVDEVAEVGLATSEEAQLLEISEGSPIFVFSRTSCIYSGQPVEYVKSFYRGDRYKIVHRLRQQDRV